MHILYIHQYFVPPDGAGGTRSYEMARRLVAAGHRVTLVTSDAFFPHRVAAPGWKRLTIDGIDLVVLPIAYSNRMSPLRRIRAFLGFAARSAWRSISARDVDVVFATSTPLTVAIPGILAKLRHRSPMVFEVRDLWPEIPIALGALRNPLAVAAARLLEKVAYRASAHVVALSPGMAAGVEARGIPSSSITVIPNASDLETFGDADQRAATFRESHPEITAPTLVAYAGTLGKANGIGYLADIAAAMRDIDPTIGFVVAGDGAEREAIVDRAIRLDVWGRGFWLIPPIPKREVAGLLGAAALATSFFIDEPTLWHNSANKLFDALAAGRPIAINHRGWQAELLDATGAGLVLPPHDSRAAAMKIRELVTDPVALERARRAASELAATRFERNLLAEDLRRVLEGVVAR